MDDAESIATIPEAIDRGVNLIDTGDFYGGGHNELLVGRAIAGRRDKVVLSVKFGGLRLPTGMFIGSRRARIGQELPHRQPHRLGVDHIDVYRPAWLNPQVPIEDTVGAIGDLIKVGYVRYIGLSEIRPETIRRAHAVHPICGLQFYDGDEMLLAPVNEVGKWCNGPGKRSTRARTSSSNTSTPYGPVARTS